MPNNELPIPTRFDPDKIGEVWKVDYESIAKDAENWREEHSIKPAGNDDFRICLMAVDVQNTFCIPDFELFVAGRSGTGAVDDNRRLAKFIYRNLHRITQIIPTMDTHQPMQIFHSIFFVDEEGNHPDPLTIITVGDVEEGRWKINPEVSQNFDYSEEYMRRHLLNYTKELKERGKYDLTVWPYHAMLTGIGHALVSAVEEAIFFHTIARYSQPEIIIKGRHPLTEHYSAIGPEVKKRPDGKQLASQDKAFLNMVKKFDAVVVAGQAKSHCVAWTMEDLINEIKEVDENLVQKIYLLEDCTSPVVVPGVVDYTEEADRAFERFADAGMHLIKSTEPIENWLNAKK